MRDLCRAPRATARSGAAGRSHILANKQEAARLADDAHHVEAVIHMFNPDHIGRLRRLADDSRRAL
jgi:hypothetical protein